MAASRHGIDWGDTGYFGVRCQFRYQCSVQHPDNVHWCSCYCALRISCIVIYTYLALWFNSSPRSAAYIRQRTGSALVQVIACRLSGAMPPHEPMLAYCQLDSWEEISVKFSFKKIHLKIPSVRMVAILCRGRWVNGQMWTGVCAEDCCFVLLYSVLKNIFQ